MMWQLSSVLWRCFECWQVVAAQMKHVADLSMGEQKAVCLPVWE